MIEWRIAKHNLHPLHRAVYAIGHIAPMPLADETAALLACGAGALLSHVSAGILWGLISESRGDGLIHITVPMARAPHPYGVCLHRTRRPPPITIRHSLPVTTPARTLLDLADTLRQNDLDWAVDEAITQRLTSSEELQSLARAANGRRGASKLGAAAARHTGPRATRSRAEQRLLELVRAAGLPEPQTNVRVHGCLVDAYWPERRLVVEVDGYKYHRSRVKLERDSAKTAKLLAVGIAVMRVTWPQMEDTPLVVIARLAQALVNRRPAAG